MKLRYLHLIVVLILTPTSFLLSQYATPTVENVTFTQRTDDSFIVDVYYDVNDSDGDTMTISMQVSDDDGDTWDFSCNNITGDVGPGIISGTGKHIIWDFGAEHPETFGDQFRVKILADDGIIVMGIPCPDTPIVTYGGHRYKTVQIGDQCWLKENLNIGTMITSNGVGDHQTDNGILEKYCYNNNEENCDIYGGLYQWKEAVQYIDTEGAQGICPEGWHLPTFLEIHELMETVGDSGNTLKALGQGIGDGTGTNTSGFSALLAGYRAWANGHFGVKDVTTMFWTSAGVSEAGAMILGDRSTNVSYASYNTNYGFSVRCLKGSPNFNQKPNTPSNPTPEDESTDLDTAITISWTCSDPEGDSLTYDVYLGVSNPPTEKVAEDLSINSLDITDLLHGAPYYWRVVAKDGKGNSTNGPVWQFSTVSNHIPCPETPTVTYGGQVYNTVQIGDQCWLKENLNIGTMIASDGVGDDQTDNGILEKYCYDNAQENCEIYGGLYQWSEAMMYIETEGAQGICPEGWHLPTFDEIHILMDEVGDSGNVLKAIGQGIGEGAGTNTSGFTALLAGNRAYANGGFGNLNLTTFYWTSAGASEAGTMVLGDRNNSVFYTSYNTNNGFSIRCLKGSPDFNQIPDIPSNPTPEDESVDQDTVITLSWECSDPDGDSLTYDVYLGVNTPPTEKVAEDLVGNSLNLTDLFHGATYYWRIVAKDGQGNSTNGPEWKFSTTSNHVPCPETPTVTYGGHVYNTVQIGDQCWLKENLNIGTMISSNSAGDHQTDNGILEKYCYDNDEENCDTYGGLYQWGEAMQYADTLGSQGICPEGWHLPTFDEIDTLIAEVGDSGNVLKAIGQGVGEGAGTNTSGFTALLTGKRAYTNGNFSNVGETTFYWTSAGSSQAGTMVLGDRYSGIDYASYNFDNGFSVRCLKD
ncbi:MAG: FISUMP domain-containing protein [Bacteroidota bacterium]